MKVALVFPNNIFRAPYINYYLELLDSHKIQYDIFNWDRSGTEEPNCISYQSKEESRKTWKLVLEFFRYRKFIKSKLEPKDYDRVIVFSCQIAILLSSFLIKNFKDKYLVDIRDFTKIVSIFKSRFRKVLKNADLICISSRGFRSWLPANLNYTISHNFRIKSRVSKRTYSSYINWSIPKK